MKKNLIFLLIAAFAIFSGCSNNSNTSSNEVPKPNYKTPPFIIDAHMHYKATDEWEKSFIDIYTKHNAMACVMVPMKDIDRGIKFAQAHPDRVIPYIMVDIDAPTVLADIQKAHDMGYKGVGEIFAKNYWNYDDQKYEPIWALAEKLGMPIAPHTGIHASGRMSRMQPGFLATIGSMHPNLWIHAAHFGNPWYAEAGEVARRNDKNFFDITGSSLIKKEDNPGIWKEYLWWTHLVGKKTPHMPATFPPAFEKLVFGTDEGPDQLEENIRRFNKMLDANDVPDSSRVKIYGGTLARIHGIKVPAK
jgi:predicted TIM-barrel fold metal-dependent hydrolase